MSLFLGWSNHGKPLTIRATHLYSTSSSLELVPSSIQLLTPPEVKPLTPPVRARRPTHLTEISRGSQSWFGLLILSLASRTNTRSPNSRLGRDHLRCLSRSQGVLPSACRRYREITSPESVGIQARMGHRSPAPCQVCSRVPFRLLAFASATFAHSPRLICADHQLGTIQQLIPQMVVIVLLRLCVLIWMVRCR